jgi:hypothetical protein
MIFNKAPTLPPANFLKDHQRSFPGMNDTCFIYAGIIALLAEANTRGTGEALDTILSGGFDVFMIVPYHKHSVTPTVRDVPTSARPIWY